MHSSRRAILLFTALALVTSAFLSSSSVLAAGPWSATTVVSGLKLPRGIAFDGASAMYVAESGSPGPGAQGVTNSGAVNKYKRKSGAWSKSWTTPFTSTYSSAHGPTEVLGPSGMSASGTQVLMIMALNTHEVPAPQIGHLYQLNPANGAATDRGNVGDQTWEWTNDHKSLFEDFPDSNPYGVVIAHGEDEDSRTVTYVIDAGANTVTKVRANGTTKVVAYIPNETPVAGLPTRDASPTCAAQGPDGALYVGTLDFARNLIDPAQGWSHVYRINLDEHEGIFEAAEVWASGLTSITSCTFDRSGNFWATEMFKFNAPAFCLAPRATPCGDVVRIPFSDPAHPQHIGGGASPWFPFPGGIAQGGDGAMYVTVNSAFPIPGASGAVVRLAEAD